MIFKCWASGGASVLVEASSKKEAAVIACKLLNAQLVYIQVLKSPTGVEFEANNCNGTRRPAPDSKNLYSCRRRSNRVHTAFRFNTFRTVCIADVGNSVFRQHYD